MLGVKMNHKIMPGLTLIIFAVLIVTAASAYAEEFEDVPVSDTPYYLDPQLEQNLVDIGINPTGVSNCADCSYNAATGTLSLTPGSSIDLLGSELAEGTVIELNGGTLFLAGEGRVFGSGTYTAGNPPVLEKGRLEFNEELRATTLEFRDSAVQTSAGGTVEGTGRVEKGVIFLNTGTVTYQSFQEHLVNAQIQSFQEGKVTIRGGKDFRMGKGDDYLSLGGLQGTEAREVQLSNHDRVTIISVGKLFDNPALATGEYGQPPVFIVHGKPTFRVGDHPEFFQETLKPLTLTLNGEDHLFLGKILLRNGELILPKIEKAQLFPNYMVDGVYINPSESENVNIFFDDQEHDVPAYLALGKKLRMHGSAFEVALGEEGKGCPSIEFCFTFIDNNYIATTSSEESSVRLLFKFIKDSSGRPGEVVVDPETKSVNVKGDIVVKNGIHRLHYYPLPAEGQQHYTYAPASCGGWGEESCAMVDYDFSDGGMVNFVQQQGIPAVSVGKEKIIMGGYNGKDEVEVELDRSQVYVLGYRGGEFPSEFFGTFEKRETPKEKVGWGHVGLFYCAPSSAGCIWTVTEADGLRVSSAALEESLFRRESSGFDGIWRVVDDTGAPVRAEKIIRHAESITGAPYGTYSLLKNSFSCVEVVCSSVKAAGVTIEKPDTVSFASISPPDLSLKATAYQILAESSLSAVIPHIPDTVVQSPNLQPVKVNVLPGLNNGAVNGELVQQTPGEEGTAVAVE